MDQKILDFLTNNRISTLAVLLPDGFPHAAVMHYSHQAEPLILYFSTANTSRKYNGLQNAETVKAAVVVGLDEKEWITLQLEGEIQLVSDPVEFQKVQEAHYAKHPSSAKFKDDPATVFLKFTPKWWKYTDFNSEPITAIGSD